MSESRKPGPDPQTPQGLPEVLSEDKPALREGVHRPFL